MLVVPSCLCGLLSFFISAFKKQYKRYFCNLQEDLDNNSFLREAVFCLRWNSCPVELMNNNFVSAFFIFWSRRPCRRSVLQSVWLLFELVTYSIVHRDRNTMVYKKVLHPSPVSTWRSLRTILLESWTKKEKHLQLYRRLLVQDSFLTITSRKTPSEINRSLTCMWSFQVNLNYFI